MLRMTALTAVLALQGFGGAALAAEGQGGGIKTHDGAAVFAIETDPGFQRVANSPARCKALVKLKADFDAKTHWTQLTPGQFHFVEGVYVGSPSTPDGLPPGDGAVLAQHDGDKDGVIVWTRGPLACAPLPIPEKLIKLMGSIKTGALDDNGDEL
jgi:hypothetical protein